VVWGLWVAGGVFGDVSSTSFGVELDVGRGLDVALLGGIASNSGKRKRRTMNSDWHRWISIAEGDEQ